MPQVSTTSQVSHGLNLDMPLKDGGRLAELMQAIVSRQAKISQALTGLHYVHFARFLPQWSTGRLLVITEFDGDLEDYVMDFAVVLADEFSLILSYMQDPPRLPVQQYPRDFWDYIRKHNRQPDGSPHPDPYSAYPDKCVIDLLDQLPARGLPVPPAPIAVVNVDDVQGNVVRGFGGRQALHLVVQFGPEPQARALLASLLSGPGPTVSSGREWPAGEPAPGYCLNVGLTHAGLKALGVPSAVLDAFPAAFVDGPLRRGKDLGDTPGSRSDPAGWRIGARPDLSHALLSLQIKPRADLGALAQALRDLVAQHGAQVIEEQTALTLGDQGDEIHFGYRDGIAQPRIAGLAAEQPGVPAPVPAGDLLLGGGYRNSRDGNFIADLPPELADNGTYAALRVIEQDVEGFERWLEQVARDTGVGRDLIAAKLMGRWANGSPLVLWPEAPGPTSAHDEFDRFDYVPQPPTIGGGDVDGLRCPFGAHIRRLNPRGAFVVGVPSGRRVMRRGMPYGSQAGSEEKGLVGLFLCGDLASQFEFLQKAWANHDLFGPGVRGTTDAFVGARPGATPFRFRVPGRNDEVCVQVPPLTRTRGSLYLFLPGLSALRWLAGGLWMEPANKADPDLLRPLAAALDTRSSTFHAQPTRWFGLLRHLGPLHTDPNYKATWVLSHALVKEAAADPVRFPKPPQPFSNPNDPLAIPADGLFFMNPPRHGEVRPIMEGLLAEATRDFAVHARAVATRVAKELAARSGDVDLVRDYAALVPVAAFMDWMGVPGGSAAELDGWVRKALAGHDRFAPEAMRRAAGQSSVDIRNRMGILMQTGSGTTAAGRCPLLRGMAGRTGPTANPTQLSTAEAMQTGLHLALGGYESTEFLIASGLHNLLQHPDQLLWLQRHPEGIDNAVSEMLRFDTPFQMAERVVCKGGAELGGELLPEGHEVALVYGSANRDPAVFQDPDRFDIRRDPGELAQHFGFGHGIHTCVGASIARPMASIAIMALLESCTRMRLVDVGPWLPDPFFRSLTRLKVSLN